MRINQSVLALGSIVLLPLSLNCTRAQDFDFSVPYEINRLSEEDGFIGVEPAFRAFDGNWSRSYAKMQINPAYHGLLPLIVWGFGTTTKWTIPNDSGLIFTCPMRELKAYPALPRVRYELAGTRKWLSAFHGLLPDILNPNGWHVALDQQMYVFGPDSSTSLIGSLIHAARGRVAEARIGLAYSDAKPLLSNLKQEMDLIDAAAVDSIDGLPNYFQPLDRLLALTAQSIDRMTPKECAELIALAEKYRTPSKAWRSGIARSFASDVAMLERNIPSDGSVPKFKMYAPEFDGFVRDADTFDFDAKDRTQAFNPLADIPIDKYAEQTFIANQPRTARSAVMLHEAVDWFRVGYAHLARLLAHPFPSPTLIRDTPDWLNSFVDDNFLHADRRRYDFYALTPEYVNELQRSLIRWQMLELHAGIRKFRWEHDRLPSGLEELHMPECIINPRTNQPFDYVLATSGYSLTCAEIGLRSKADLTLVPRTLSMPLINLLTEPLEEQDSAVLP